MNTSEKTRTITMAGLLTAIAVLITISPLKLPLPQPFSVTLGSHVPTMLAIFISPVVGIFSVLGSTVGFLTVAGLGPVVAMRAASHIFFYCLGYYMVSKKQNIYLVIVLTGIVHALFEMLVVWLMATMGVGKMPENIVYITGLGTFFHHIFDFVVTLGIYSAMRKLKVFRFAPEYSLKRK